jgi:hypothetical protein
VVQVRPATKILLEALEGPLLSGRRIQVKRQNNSPSKGGEVMKGYEADDLLGIYQEDGSVKCRDCMNEEDWKNLKQEDIITSKAIERGGEWFCCDYCEKTLRQRKWARR